MLRRLLVQLRQKPKHVRDNIALGAAGSITAMVFGFWFMTTPAELLTQGAEVKDEAPKAFSTLFDQIGEQFANVRNALPKTTSTAAAPAPSIIMPEIPASTSFVVSASTTTSAGAASTTAPREVLIMTTTSTVSAATTSTP